MSKREIGEIIHVMSIFSILSPYHNLLVGISEKNDGSCRLSSTGKGEIDTATKANRERYIEKLGITNSHLVSADLAHRNVAYAAGKEDGGETIKGVDALLTHEKNLFLSVTVADCLPIFLYDKNKNAVGIIHAGWRGLALEVIPLTIEEMKRKFESNPDEVLVGIGPGIGVCHYKVEEDVLEKVRSLLPEITENGAEKLEQILPEILVKRDGQAFLDLKKMAKIQLEASGVPTGNIEISKDCTYNMMDRYFSYRRDRPEFLETMMAVIGLREAL